jgi:hypothetical protein
LKKIFLFIFNFDKYKEKFINEGEIEEFNNLRKNLFHSFKVVVLSAIIAVIAGNLFSIYYHQKEYVLINNIIQNIGAALLLWGSLFNMDKGFKSWTENNRDAEILESKILDILYVIGTMFLFFSISWS